MLHLRRKRPQDRRGTTVVETAFVLPVYLVFVFGIIEFGHVQLVNTALRSATRIAARQGSTNGQTTADVQATVLRVLGSAIDTENVQVFVRDAGVLDEGGSLPDSGQGIEALPPLEISEAEPRQLFLVRARVAYNDVALLPMSLFGGVQLEGQSFIRHE